jgi:hypothetical protein
MNVSVGAVPVVAMATSAVEVGDWSRVRVSAASPSAAAHLYPPGRVARGLLLGRLLPRREVPHPAVCEK